MIPDDQAPAYYRFVAQLWEGGGGIAASAAASSFSPSEQSPWTEHDLDDALYVVGALRSLQRRVLEVLVERPNELLETTEIGRILGLDDDPNGHRVAGATGSIGQKSYERGKQFPLRWDGRHFSIDPEVAFLFRRALDA